MPPRSDKPNADIRLSAQVCILGAGPAGLSAAWELMRHGMTDVVVVEVLDGPGGLSRTDPFRGQRYDVGPHRFFTSNGEVLQLWREVLGSDFIAVSRMTRIYYRDRFFRYPISAFDALPKLGPVQAIWALASFLRASLGSDPERAETFEEWVSASFGRKLYDSFFRVYTEKVWGVPCSRISADWAAQRIKGLDLWEVARRALPLGGGAGPKTLVEEFDYPRLGAGQMAHCMQERLEESGVRFVFGQAVERLVRRGRSAWRVETPGLQVEAGHVLSSMPISELLRGLEPAPEPEVLAAGAALGWREHVTVDLDVEAEGLFPDQWIYVHDPGVRMARLANYANFSASMAAPGRTPISAEYFCFAGDELWRRPDEELADLAGEEFQRMGLLGGARVAAARVRRDRRAYPSYVLGWRETFVPLREHFGELAQLQLMGRGGMFKYNNMDHSVFSGLLAARNFLGLCDAPYDLWRINIDAAYQEGAVRSS